MSTRAGQAFCATNARSVLEKALNVGKKTKSNEPLSREQLRKEYLDAIFRTHPDKAKDDDQRKEFHSNFIFLRQAWEAFDKEKAKDRTSKADDPGTFVKFGVGCSFSDSDEEKVERWEIMEQASKGWFPDGSLESGDKVT